MFSIKNKTKTNRNCLVGKGLQIKICDFVTDSDILFVDLSYVMGGTIFGVM